MVRRKNVRCFLDRQKGEENDTAPRAETCSLVFQEADIVVVMGGSWSKQGESEQDLFYKNAENVRRMAREVLIHAPRALIGIAVPPTTSMLAFFAEVAFTVDLCSEDQIRTLIITSWITSSLK